MEAESGARQPKSRRRLRRNDPASTKELILDEAARLIERQGVAEMMIKDIADAVGIRPPSVYKHFASREDVVAELVTRYEREIAEDVAPDDGLPPKAWIEQWVKEIVLFFALKPAYARLSLHELSRPGGDPTINARAGALDEAIAHEPLLSWGRRLGRKLAAGVKADDFALVEAADFSALVIGATIFSVVWPFRAGGGGRMNMAEIERLQRSVVAAAFAILRRRP